MLLCSILLCSTLGAQTATITIEEFESGIVSYMEAVQDGVEKKDYASAEKSLLEAADFLPNFPQPIRKCIRKC